MAKNCPKLVNFDSEILSAAWSFMSVLWEKRTKFAPPYFWTATIRKKNTFPITPKKKQNISSFQKTKDTNTQKKDSWQIICLSHGIKQPTQPNEPKQHVLDPTNQPNEAPRALTSGFVFQRSSCTLQLLKPWHRLRGRVGRLEDLPQNSESFKNGGGDWEWLISARILPSVCFQAVNIM